MNLHWTQRLLPHRKQSKPPKQEAKKIEPRFAVGELVCFCQETTDGEAYGIGEISALQSTPVMNEMGKIRSFSYVADIQPLYEIPHTWKLPPIAEEYSSDDPIAFPLPIAAILLGRLGIRTRLTEDAGSYEILKAVSGKNFCAATYVAFRHFYCGARFFSLRAFI